MSSVTRREFIVISAALLNGCTFGLESRPTRTASVATKKIDWPRNEQLVDRLKSEVSLLPPSPVKTQLQNRVISRYLGQPVPFTVDFEGINVEVKNISLHFDYVRLGSAPGGFFTPISGNVAETHRVQVDQEYDIPLLVGVPEDQKPKFTNKLPDGTIYVKRNFPTGRTLFFGLVPEMGITRFTDLSLTELQVYMKFERYAIIKEACGWLLWDALIEETSKKMNTLGLKTTIRVTNNGREEEKQVLTNVLRSIANNRGRTLALLDWAGYLLAFRAAEGTDYYSSLDALPHFKVVMDQVRGYDYGSTHTNLLYKSAEKVYDSPDLTGLHAVGDISKLP